MKSNPMEVNQTYHESKCIEFGSYNLLITHAKNGTESSNMTYSLKAGETVLFQDSTNTYLDVENEFTVCSSNTDCLDYDGCTVDFCNPDTRTCQNTLNATCTNCKWVAIKISPDNYPEETTWFLRNHKNKDLVLSGDPYLTFDRVHGRKKKNGR